MFHQQYERRVLIHLNLIASYTPPSIFSWLDPDSFP